MPDPIAREGEPQSFLFERELSEVYLLLDHISGRADKELPNGSAGVGPDSIEQICMICWPPEGTRVEQARQAATLLRTKDALNGAARPANGSTIAFTILVSGGDDTAGTPSSPGRDGDSLSRRSLAALAYPGLIGAASRFRATIRWIIVALVLWLLFTCALSWNIAAGHAVLSRIDALAAARDDIMAKINAADLEEDRRAGPAVAASPPAPADVPPYCERHRVHGHGSSEHFDSLTALRVCDPLDRNVQAHRIAYANLADWLQMWSFVKWLPHWMCGGPCLASGQNEAPLTRNATDEQWASILNEVLAGAVLPVCYGILGAAAAIVRDLWRKMRDSLLSPRDLTLSLGQLALGAVIGACIGLFVTPSGGGGGATGASLTGSVTLSASALSFIAGFGVEGVFVALESFIKRVFNLK
jgi:hypothetical protein